MENSFDKTDVQTLSASLESMKQLLDVYENTVLEQADKLYEEISERKKAQEIQKLNEERLESLLKISHYESESIQDLLDFALDEAISLTGSKIGYIYFYDDHKKEFTLNTWSKDVMKECTIVEPQTVYQLEKTGMWGEAVRQARPIVVNDFQAPHPLKKGYPEGHAPLFKYLTIPIFSGESIVSVAAVANKETDYEESDIRQLTLLMDSVWKIVDKKWAEEALRYSEAFLNKVIEESPNPMWISDKEGTLTRVNRSLSDTINLTEDIVVGKYNVLKDENLEIQSVMPSVRAVFEKGETERFTIPWKAAAAGDVDFIGARDMHIDVSMFPILDAQGELTNVVCQWVDVTERRQAEEQYRILAESSLAGVYVVQDGEFRFINSNAASYAGYAKEELMDREAEQVVHPEDREMAKMNTQAMLRGERISPYEYRIITKKGEIRWIMETVASISYKGKRAVLGNSMDITKKKKASLQLLQSEKMASIGQLAAGVAHEINNPTAFVNSNLKTLSEYLDDVIKVINQYRALSEILRNEATGDSLHELLAEHLKLIECLEAKTNIDFVVKDIVALIGESREGTERIRRIVQDLKNFAHPGDEKLRTVNIKDSVESTLNIVWNELKYKAFVHKEYGDIPDILGYPQQLNQVFMNILVNAAQAIKDKGEIRIATRVDDGHVEIKFTDTGVGIPKENLPKLFDPFFTTKDVGKGTGLGLHVAYSIIKKHNGTIEVESMVDKGTTFTVKIPLEL